MADPIQPTIPRSFMTDMPAATMSASMTLLSRRSAALADFWRSCAEVRQPTELMALQLNYWTQLVDDYQEAMVQGLSQMTPAPNQAAAQARSGPMAHSA